MKESMWGYLIIALGIVIVAVLFLVQRLTTTNEQDVFLSREILESSMYDAVDWGTYLKSGKLVMSKEKFVAIFTRIFAESVSADRTYTLNFYDIYEYPPKATIMIKTTTGETVIKEDGVNLDVNTFLTGILETQEDTNDVIMSYSTAYADVNFDGKLDEADLTLIKQFADGTKTPNNNQKKAADVDGDGKVTVADLRIVQKVVYALTPLDVNLDGVFDEEDYTLTEKFIKNKVRLSEKQQIAADVNNDGKIDSKDLAVMGTALK